MKIYRLISIAIAMLFAQPVAAQSQFPANTALWGVGWGEGGNRNQVFRRGDGGWLEQVPGSLKQVSVGADGAVWGVDPDDNVLRWTGSQWQQVQGTKLNQLSVRNAQEVWGVNAAGNLFRWNGSTWDQIPSTLAYVSVGADGTVCGIGKDGNVYRRDASTWTPMTAQGQKFRRISVTNKQRVLGIDTSGNLLRWTGTGLDVVRNVDSYRYEFVDAVETADGTLWDLFRDSDGNHFIEWRAADNQSMGPSYTPLTQIAVVSPLAPPAGLTAEQQQMLDAHNRERANYPGVSALQWAPELAQWAQEWAQTLASKGGFGDHRPDQLNNPFRPRESLGENIYWYSGRPTTGDEAVQSWISEKQGYNYNQDNGMAACCNQPPGCTPPPNTPYCWHFTQVIWKPTQYVGCGKASAGDRDYYVCNYYPKGNIREQKPY
jgi:hypothetical protein